MSKGGNDTQTTTQNSSTTYPQWTQIANQAAAGAGLAMNLPWMKVPAYQLAGFNADQEQAFDLARQSARQAYTGGTTGVGDTSVTSARLGAPSMAKAQTLDPKAISGYMNPFLEQVGTATLGNMRREYENADAGISARYGSGQAFGGSGEAIARGQAARGYNENVATTISNLMAQGYDRATALAQADAQTRQQTDLTNAGARNQSTLTQGGYDQQASMLRPQLAMDRARLEDALRTSDLSRQQSALQQLLGIGNQQQLFGQTVLDMPYTALARYAAFVPNVYNTTGVQTSTAPDNSPSPLQSLLGIAGEVALAPTTGGGSLLGSWLG